MPQILEQPTPVEKDFLPLNGTDYVEFYVGNARQSAYFYRSAFGFKLVSYQGPETGVRDRASYVLVQDKIRFVLTTAMQPDHAINAHVRAHGDGVRDIALWVDDAESAWRETTKRGARSVREPETLRDAHGEVRLSAIGIYGDTIHTFVERRNYNGPFLPGFVAVESEDTVSRPVGLKYIDHMVGNVGWGEMNRWVDFYRDVMGFRMFKHFDDKDISTEYSALMSKVMSNGNERVKFPINEPAEGKRKSQIEEYLEFYHAPGVQHIAMATADIIETVGTLKRQGVDFLRVPNAYYDDLLARTGPIDEPIAALKELGILVDRDDEGYMLQIFTRPVEDRPTLFYEVIQRKGSRSFGKGNFKALFEAIEREQERRGNL
ncbi:MAG TPA: 4-hydroxyphenylpyruvate dioxygenase [Candidatus Sulfopaludibacter sp.]|jgi:4-hydroxyphenylpyruvate dioxygenase|nr:4-hydroxyphenylpyruvate dioxygenase [Candidatus Sulfopaludibacter sp.]